MSVKFDPAKPWSKTAIMGEYMAMEATGALPFAKAYEIGNTGEKLIGFPALVGDHGDTVQEHTIAPPDIDADLLASVLCVFAERWRQHRNEEEKR